MLQHWNDLRCLKRRHIVFSFSDTNPPQKWENWRWGPRNRDLLANGFFCFGISTHLQPKALEFQQIFPILSGCSRKRSHPVFFLPIFFMEKHPSRWDPGTSHCGGSKSGHDGRVKKAEPCECKKWTVETSVWLEKISNQKPSFFFDLRNFWRQFLGATKHRWFPHVV